MVSPTDPNEVRMTGENSFIRLHTEQGGPMTTRASHWRVLLSPGGSGHALFLKSDVTDDQVRVYADNIAVARWLQEEIESLLFPEFANQTIPVIDAVFGRAGEGMSFWTETVESEDESISLTWYDFAEPFMIRVEAGSVPGRPHGVYSCFVPARRAQLTLEGSMAGGVVLPEERDGRTSSTACLAWSETWVRPY
ncbi:MAG: hypothetical protein IH956_01075 [Chloroflexi bacterium]|nr:hypothetical protein [Chloroflexota bacterium]